MSHFVNLKILSLGVALAFSAFAFSQNSFQSRLRLIPIVSDQRLEDIQESRDGTRLLTHDRGFAPRLWEPKSMRLLGVLPHQYSSVEQATMSPSGEIIGTVSDEEVYIWNSKSARSIMSWTLFESKNEKFNRIVISPDDKTVAIGGENGSIWIARAPLFKLAPLTQLPGKTPIKDLQFSPDGTLLAACAPGNPNILTYNLAQQTVTILTGPSEGTAWIEVSPDSHQLLATGLDNRAHLFDLKSAKAIKSFEHIIGDKGTAPQTLMAALFVGPELNEIIVCGGTGTMTIFDRITFEKKRELRGYTNPIREIRKSVDGLKVATYEDNEYTGEYEPLKIWDVVTTKEFPFERTGGPTAGAFNPLANVFWVGYDDGQIVQHKLNDGSFASNTVTAVDPVYNIHFLANTGRLAISRLTSANNYFLFDARKVDLSTMFTSGEDILYSSSNGAYIISPAYVEEDDGSTSVYQAVWTAATQKAKWIFWDECENAVWASDTKTIAWDSNEAHLFDMGSEKEEAHVDQVIYAENSVSWVKGSNDGHIALINTNKEGNESSDTIHIYDINENEIIAKFQVTEFVPAASYYINQKNPIIVETQEEIRAYEPTNGKQIWSMPFPTINGYSINYQIKYSKNGESLLLVSSTEVLLVNSKNGEVLKKVSLGTSEIYYTQAEWDQSNNIIAIFQGRQVAFVDANTLELIVTLTRPDIVRGVTFLPEHKRVLINDQTEQITIWDLNELTADSTPQSLAPIGSFVIMSPTAERDRSSWLVIDRDGRFDAPEPNNVTGASYVLEWEDGLEPIDVSQLKSLYYEPGLFGKLCGFDQEPKRQVPDRKSIRLFPEVTIKQNEKNPNRLTVLLEERDKGGVGKAEIFLNNKLLFSKDKTGLISINLEEYKTFFLPASQLPAGSGNKLSVVAWNEKGDLASLPTSIDVGVPSDLAVPPVNMYGLFVGIGDYAGAQKDLSAPPMDAEKLALALKSAGERLLPGHIHIKTLTTNDQQNTPTRESILSWFEETSKVATSSDIIVVFFAGHGTSSIGSNRGYFFLTPGADPADITPAILGIHTISGEDLQASLSKIPAGKQVVILDTCHSGAAASNIIQDRSSGSDYVRAYESIRDSSGTWLLAGAAADQLSYEARAVDHGLLTYSLLEALDQVTPQGLRVTPSGQVFIDVERWLSYAATRVESLRSEVGVDGVQMPELKRSKNDQTFDLGVTGEQFRGEIGLKPPKPIVLMGTFEEDGEDDLGLEPAIVLALKDEPNFKLWLNVAKHPNVFRIAGQYAVDGDKITLRLYVQKFDDKLSRKNIGEAIIIEGIKNDIPDLVRKIKEALGVSLNKITRSGDQISNMGERQSHKLKDSYSHLNIHKNAFHFFGKTTGLSQ